MIRILITGSRKWSNKEALYAALKAHTEHLDPSHVTIVHGDCPTGADALADKYAREQGFHVEKYPADWSKGRSAGPMRNKLMVSKGADVCLAFPLGSSPGTRGCMRFANEAGIVTKVFPG